MGGRRDAFGDDRPAARLLEQIREAKRRGKSAAVGGPYPTAVPADAEAAGADYLVLDEGELTVPKLVRAMEQASSAGEPTRALVFRSSEKPDVRLGAPRSSPRSMRLRRRELRALVVLCWRQGALRATRWKFWHRLLGILWQRPAVAPYYLKDCAHYVHLREYRQMVRHRLGPSRTVPARAS